jgi:predicted regulator of Ras-like GTPase activity (Roadblock/LC7/MglB family)
MANYQPVVESLTRLRGVRGAMVVGLADGLVVAESLMGGVKSQALAALSAALVTRAADLSRDSGFGPVRFLHLHCSDGAVLVAPTTTEMAVVAVAGRDAPLGLARLELLRLAERLA